MSKFDELINNLKKDIQSLPSVDAPIRECGAVVVEESVSVPAMEMMVEKKENKYLKLFMRHGLLSTEFFLFFVIFLSATRPPFLYYNEKVVRNGRELLKTHFSVLYLISYSFFFTCLFHLLILIHRDVSKRY